MSEEITKQETPPEEQVEKTEVKKIKIKKYKDQSGQLVKPEALTIKKVTTKKDDEGKETSKTEILPYENPTLSLDTTSLTISPEIPTLYTSPELSLISNELNSFQSLLPANSIKTESWDWVKSMRGTDNNWLTNFEKGWKTYSFGILDNAVEEFSKGTRLLADGFDVSKYLWEDLSKELSREFESWKNLFTDWDNNYWNANNWLGVVGINKGKSDIMKEAQYEYYMTAQRDFDSPELKEELDKKLAKKYATEKLEDLIPNSMYNIFSDIMMDPDAELQYFIAWISRSREETPIKISKGGQEAKDGKNANYFFYLNDIDFAPATKSTSTLNYGGMEIQVFTNHVEGKNIGKFSMLGDLGLSFYNYVLKNGLGYNTEKGTYSDVIDTRKFSNSSEESSYAVRTKVKAEEETSAPKDSGLDLHVMIPGWYLDSTKTFYVNHFILRSIKFTNISNLGFSQEAKQMIHSVEFDYLKALWIHNRPLTFKG